MTEIVEITIDESGKILIWDPSCIQFLRKQCRIFGKFIGTVARAPHKTPFKGLPITLGFEELVTLLKERCHEIRLVASSCLLSRRVGPTTDEIITHHKRAVEDNYKQICSIVAEEKIRKSELHFESINKMSSRKRKADELAVHPNPVPKLDEKSVVIHLPTATPAPWLREHEKEQIPFPTFHTLADSIEFLMSLFKDRLGLEIPPEIIVKCAVFHNLWSKGHCIAISCKKMGGNYLLYPGDPWIHHATHVVRIISSSLDMRPSEWISSVRLINSLKKICLIAWYDENAFKQMFPQPDVNGVLDHLRIAFNSLSWCGRIP